MASPKNPAETLLRKGVTVTLVNEDDEETVLFIRDFAFAKTLKTFSLVSELAMAANIREAVSAVGQDAEAGNLEEGTERPATNFIAAIIDIIPAALTNGVPSVYKLIGLIPLTNRELKELEKSDADVDAVLLERGRDFAYEYDIDAVVSLVAAAAQVIGVETIVRHAGPLLKMLRAPGA